VVNKICPEVNKDSNRQFLRTLEQAISKHLTAKPRYVTLLKPCQQLLLSQQDAEGEEKTLKRKVVSYLLGLPEKACNVNDLSHIGNLKSIARLLHRHAETFFVQEKLYRIEEASTSHMYWSYQNNQQVGLS
jgi:hypothetical protein